MRSVLIVLAAVVATVAAGMPAAAQNDRSVRKPLNIDRSMLRLAPVQSEAEARKTSVYVVQMAAKPAISYTGGLEGFARTAPRAGAKYDARSGRTLAYTAHLEAEQDAALARVGAASRKIYSYRHTINGFAARLTGAEAMKLSKDKNVLKVWQDRKLKLDTNNSPSFLGLTSAKTGLRTRHGLRGKGIIIGMLDSGAVQEHPSFNDKGLKPPTGWNGICQPGEGWDESDCNNKLIGARWFNAGFLAAGPIEPTEFLSARDSDGHGTHTATTAAGRRVQASLAGTPVAFISGMAPDAHVAIYKPCWEDLGGDQGAGCFFSDSAMATDAAVADGVDILSFSVGTAAAFNDPQDIAFLNAVDAGVFVSRSAGNEGPGPSSTAAGEPWVMTVGASTHSGTAFANAARVNSPASVARDYPALEGAITKPLAETGPVTDNLVAANPINACTPIDPVGSMVLIARGDCTFDVKLTNAVAAGADSVLVYTSPAENPKTVMGGDLTFDIPGMMIDNAPGLALLAALNGGATVSVTLSAAVFVTESIIGNIMAGFSSRGPFATEPDWVKPDITAPGVRVLAGATPEPNDGSAGDLFQYLQGTSMSTPHVAGVAALIKQKRPSWTPAQIKSALMTTARQGIVKEDGVTRADPFDFGAGHMVPNKAIDPGLTFDAGFLEYLAATCGTVSPLVSDADCGTLESFGLSLDPADLNLPSIGVSEVLGTKVIRRTLTNVGPFSTYRARYQSPPGFRVRVKPKNLTLAHGQSKTVEITIQNVSAPPNEWRFGHVRWDDDKGHMVRSPVALKAQTLVAPQDLAGEGAAGATSFDVTFGYNGAYMPAAHGLENPFHTPATVEDDPNNSFVFLGPGTIDPYFFEVEPGIVYAQWSLYDAYTDGAHDLDMFVFYCPLNAAQTSFECVEVANSATATSNEQVGIDFPINDPDNLDPYLVLVHGFDTEGGEPANFVLFDWTFPGPGPDLGNMVVTGPSTAAIGQTGTVNVNWMGLATGPGAKQVGAISHSDGSTVHELTRVNIQNDGDAGYDDLCAIIDCAPPPPAP